jgi:hypothetical protein
MEGGTSGRILGVSGWEPELRVPGLLGRPIPFERLLYLAPFGSPASRR